MNKDIRIFGLSFALTCAGVLGQDDVTPINLIFCIIAIYIGVTIYMSNEK